MRINSPPTVTATDVSKLIHPHPGACCVSVGEMDRRGPGVGMTVEEYGCCPIYTLRRSLMWCILSSSCAYCFNYKRCCLCQLHLAAVCIHQLMSIGFDRERAAQLSEA